MEDNVDDAAPSVARCTLKLSLASAACLIAANIERKQNQKGVSAAEAVAAEAVAVEQ